MLSRCLVWVLVALLGVGPHGLMVRPALATPVVGAPVVSPGTIPAGQPTLLTVSSQITVARRGPQVIPTSVLLLRLDPGPQPMSVLAELRDDGTGGDAVAGDGLFTATVSVIENAPGSLRLRVSAAFVRTLRRVFSGVTRVPIVAGSPTDTPTAAAATSTHTPTDTPTGTPTHTPTLTASESPTTTATQNPTETASPTRTTSPTRSPTVTPTQTRTSTTTATATESPTATRTITPTTSATATPTLTPSPMYTATNTPGGPLSPPLVQEPPRNPNLGYDPNDSPDGLVLLHSGELRVRRTDMAIRGRHMAFTFTRTYRSGNHDLGPLGFGWDANIFRRLEVLAPGDVIRHDGTGRRDVYVKNGAGRFQSPRGFYTTLLDDGAGFKLRFPNGTKEFYDASGAITRVEGRIGNSHDFTYTGGRLTSISDEFGRTVTLTYAANGRLERLMDFTGREVLFAYDAADHLIESRSPLVSGTPHGNDFPLGRRERYVYDVGAADPSLAHNLTAIVAPSEVADGSLTPRVMVTYELMPGFDFDRIRALTVGGTNASGVAAGGTVTYAYDFNPAGGPAATFSRTTVTDRNGTTNVYDHDADGHCVRIVEDSGGGNFTTLMTYNADGDLTGLTTPLGNMVVYEYDDTNPDRFQQGNLLSMTHIPDASRSAAQSQIRTTWTYEPLFNRVHTVTTPRGNDPSFVPPNGGVNSVARYTTTYTYDYQEAPVVPAEAIDWSIPVPMALLGRGDVNFDGRTDQAMGDRIRYQLPSNTLLSSSQQAGVEGDTTQEVVDVVRFNDFGQPIAHENARGNVTTFEYFSEQDPDGDGFDLIAGRDPTAGGYGRQRVEDAVTTPRRQESTAPVGITSPVTYDPRGNIATYTDGRGNAYRYVFNQLDEVIEKEDPQVAPTQANGYLQRYVYDDNGNVVARHVENQTADASGMQVLVGTHPFFIDEFRYDILDNRIEETLDATRPPGLVSTQPEFLTTRFRYDANENLIRAWSPRAVSGADPNNMIELVYDPRDLVAAMKRGGSGADATTQTFTYDGNRNRVQVTDAEDNDGIPGGESATYVHDGFDRLVINIDRGGNQLLYSYDPANLQTRREFRGPVDGGGGPSVRLAACDMRHDEAGRLFERDCELFLPAGTSVGFPIVLVDGALTPGDRLVTERYEYDALNRQTFHIEDDGSVYSAEYDGADRQVRTTHPLQDALSSAPSVIQGQTTFTYDQNGNVVKRVQRHVSPDGLNPPVDITSFSVFDGLNRRIRFSDTLGQTTYFDYDSRGNVVATFDQRGALTSSDPLGVFPGGINARGNPTRFTYDGINRRWQTVHELHQVGQGNLPLDLSNPFNPDGLVTLRTDFDANGNIVSRTDDDGNVTTYAYDSLDRLTTQILADGSTATFAYDRDHNLVAMTDENNTRRSMTYDALGRLVHRSFVTDASKRIAGGTLPMLVGTTEQTFQYDGLSRLTLAVDNNDPADPGDDSTVAFAYDSLGRVVAEVQNGRTVGSSYASDDRIELHYPGAGQVVQFTYDAVDQLDQISTNTGFFAVQHRQGRCCCDPIAVEVGSTAQGTTFVERTQLNANKLPISRQIFREPGMDVIDSEGAFRLRNNVQAGISYGQTNPDTGMSLSRSASLSLSSINQVTAAGSGLSLPGGSTGGTYQALYSGSQEIRNVSGSVTMANTFDTVHQHTTPGFRYNASPGTGIRTADPNFIYQWDALNRLRVVRSAAAPATQIAEYRYDASPFNTVGRRIEKVVTNSGALDGTTRYVYQRDHVIEERAFDGIGERVDRQFIHGTLTDRPLAMDVDTDLDGIPDTLFYYGRDIPGDVTVLADESGTPVEFYVHGAFVPPAFIDAASMTSVPESPNGNPYLLKGRRYDPETGLYYNRARYFDPVTSVFLSRDPGGIWYDPSSLGNGLTYAGNNSWTASDPSGELLWMIPAVIGGLALTLAVGWLVINDGVADRVEPAAHDPLVRPHPADPPPGPAPGAGADPVTSFENMRGKIQWQERRSVSSTDFYAYATGKIPREDVHTLNCEQGVQLALMDMGLPPNPTQLPPEARHDLTPQQYQAYKQLGAAEGYFGSYGGYYQLAPADYDPCRGDVIIYFYDTTQATHIAMFTGNGWETMENLSPGPDYGQALMFHHYFQYQYYAIYQYVGPRTFPQHPNYSGELTIDRPPTFTSDGFFIEDRGGIAIIDGNTRFR